MSLMAAIERMTDAFCRFEATLNTLDDRLQNLESRVEAIDSQTYSVPSEIEDIRSTLRDFGQTLDYISTSIDTIDEVAQEVRLNERRTWLAEVRAAKAMAVLKGA